MIRQPLPPARRAWFISMASAMGLILVLGGCEQNPIIAPLPGGQWTLRSDTVVTLIDSVLYRTPGHGGSQTLYAGEDISQESNSRESGILIKFASVDTSLFADLKYARLVLIRRLYPSELTEPDIFSLASINESDTAWTESDIGLTLLDFPNVTHYADTFMVIDTVAVSIDFIQDVASDSVLEHLVFPVDTALLGQWAREEKANNGYLIRQENQAPLIGLYSRGSASFSPYLKLAIRDTTSAGTDTTIFEYDRPIQDLSIYPTSELPDHILQDGLLHLDHSNGLRSQIRFSPDFKPDTTSMVAGAHLVLHVNKEADTFDFLADQMEIQVLRRAKPITPVPAEDSLVVLDMVSYKGSESDSLILNLGDFMTDLTVDDEFESYGLELVVVPRHHDFDHLTFWGPGAPPELRPRLEIVYTRAYAKAP